MDAALELLGTEGWAAMTVRNVLERARLNPRYFYESFGGLDELAVALYDRVVEELAAAVFGALEKAGEDPGAQLRAVVACTVSFVDEDRRRGRVLYAEGLGNEALNRRRIETASMVVSFVEEYASERRPDGEASAELGRVATSILVGGFNQLLVDWLDGRIRISRSRLVDDATALFLAMGDGAVAEAASRSRR